jgi:pimeloyl-ACP methyl ester carboxylesterase
MDLIRGTGPFEELEKAQAKVKVRPWFPSVHWCDRTLFYAARQIVDYDSGPSWEKVHCPVLVIYGDRDTSSGPPGPLVAVIRQGLAKANNRDVTVHVFPGGDHSLCSAEAVKRRPVTNEKRNDPTFVAGYLELMAKWLGARFHGEFNGRNP